MKIGIIVAMQSEFDQVESLKNADGCIGGKEVALALCGIGKVNAAISTMRMIDASAPDIIVSTGIAGGANEKAAAVMDVVVGEQIAYHDVDCGPESEEGLGQVQGLPRIFKGDPALVDLAAQCGVDGVRVVRGLIATGDQFVSTVEAVSRIRSLYPNVAAVDMESAAIAHVCYLRGVKFLPMRVVSDIPGAVNQAAQYGNFWSLLGGRSFSALREFLRRV